MVRVALEIIGHLIFRRKRVASCGKWHPGKAVVSRRREESQRIPAAAPRVAHARMGVENEKRNAALRQVVAGAQSGLAASDHQGLDTLKGLCVCHVTPR